MSRFSKGHERDAGMDIILSEDTYFAPKSVTVVNLHVQITPADGECAVICPRSSAAKKGLLIANCPIDTDYVGEVHAIVFNASDSPVEYKAGESFCQFVVFKIGSNLDALKAIYCKTLERRTDGRFGSTDEKH